MAIFNAFFILIWLMARESYSWPLLRAQARRLRYLIFHVLFMLFLGLDLILVIASRSGATTRQSLGNVHIWRLPRYSHFVQSARNDGATPFNS